MQRLASECSPAVRRAQRDAQADDGAGQGRVHAQFQHAGPDIDPDQHIGGEALHPEAVHDDEDGDADRREPERQQRQVRGVEDRDDDDGAEVVDDRERQQKDLQALRHAIAEQADHAHREGDVGGGGDRPAGQRFRSPGVEQEIDQGRRRHAADRGDRRQGRLARARQLALDQLALDLEPDQEKEDRHQAVVDPVPERLVEPEIAELQAQVQLEEPQIVIGQGRVGEDEGERRRGQQHDAARCLMAQKLANRGKCHACVSPVRNRTWTVAVGDSNETGEPAPTPRAIFAR